MQLEAGLFDHMVLQRTKRNVCDVAIAGRCQAAGPVTVRVRSGRTVRRGFDRRRVGRAARGRFTARLKGLPVGGPYAIELRVGSAESVTVRDVLVGDVWLLGGQSNMQGRAEREHAEKPHRRVRAFFMDDRWGTAQDPLHNLWCAVDPVHGGRPGAPDPGGLDVGPGVAFGVAMQRRTGIPQGLIACGHGGTSLSQWDPALKTEGGRSLYGAMLRRFRKNGRRVAGMVWYQGESDATVDAAPLYTQRMQRFVRSVRRDTGDARLPFAAVQLCWYAGENWNPTWWNSIQDQQRRLADCIPRCTVAPAIDLTLCDVIHIDGPSAATLGRRLAEAMCALTLGPRAARPPIALKRVSFSRQNRQGLTDIVIEFAHVVGGLHAGGGRPQGFAVVNDQGHVVPWIFDVRLDGSRAILRTQQTALSFAGKSVSYGHGLNPPCNVRDRAGRPLPVFGPMDLNQHRLATPFVRSARVSELLPGAGKLHDLGYPSDLTALKLQPLTSEYEFLDQHLVIEKGAGDTLLFYACRLRCGEPMQLSALLGYDGPVKLWIDGALKFHDPNGTNPAKPDAAAVRFAAGAGEHDVLVALGTNGGKAWGIYLRFERLGISRRAQAAGGVTLPEVLG